jgi:23S rRNA pseudouridine2605 synthase
MSVGRLDMTSEGLLLLTNDGEIKRRLELPATGWTRRYRVRIHGTPTNEQLQPLRDGVTVEDMDYQPMEVSIDRQQGSNAWLSVTLREGKNREIRRVMEHLGFTVNRLIRVSYGPFQLGELPVGEVEEVRAKIVRDQLGLGKSEPVTRTRKKPDPAAVAVVDAEPEGRPERDRLATRRPDGATVRREMKPRTPATRKSRPEGDDAPRGRATKPSRHNSGAPSAFAKPRTWMRADDEAARAAREREPSEERPREERRPYGDKPRSTGYKSHGDRPSRAGDDRPRSSGFRSHSDRGNRPPRAEGEPPSRGYGERPARDGDQDRRPPRRFDGDSDRPRGPRPARGEGDRPARAFKPRAEGDRPARPYKPRGEGGDDRSARPYKPRSEGDRPARPYSARREGGDDRPYKPRGEGDRPARPYTPRREGDERPPRFGRKPDGENQRPPRREGEDSRPARGFKPRTEGDRPARPYTPRGEGDADRRPPRPPREGGHGDRPARPPREGEERRPPRSFGDRPAGGARPEGGRPPRKGPPREGGFSKDRPSGGRPSGGKPRKG